MNNKGSSIESSIGSSTGSRIGSTIVPTQVDSARLKKGTAQ